MLTKSTQEIVVMTCDVIIIYVKGPQKYTPFWSWKLFRPWLPKTGSALPGRFRNQIQDSPRFKRSDLQDGPRFKRMVSLVCQLYFVCQLNRCDWQTPTCKRNLNTRSWFASHPSLVHTTHFSKSSPKMSTLNKGKKSWLGTKNLGMSQNKSKNITGTRLSRQVCIRIVWYLDI